MTKGMISVIVPAYNQERYISKTLDSIANQTYRNIEIIIINDASTDNTKFEILDWIDKNPLQNINFIDNAINVGLHATLNLGLDLIQGEYFQILAGDDLIVPEKLSFQIELLKSNPNVDYAYCSHYVFDDKGTISYADSLKRFFPDKTKIPQGRIFWRVLRGLYYSYLTVLCKTNVLQRHMFRFDPKIIMEDLHFQYYLAINFKALGVNHVLAGYRFNQTGNSITNKILSDSNLIQERELMKLYLLLLYKNSLMTKLERRTWLVQISLSYLSIRKFKDVDNEIMKAGFDVLRINNFIDWRYRIMRKMFRIEFDRFNTFVDLLYFPREKMLYYYTKIFKKTKVISS